MGTVRSSARHGARAAGTNGAPPADAIGHVEQYGIGHIPESDRRSNPANISWILFGGSITYSIIVIGWLPIAFGLGWWSAVSAIIAGSAVGAMLLAPMSLPAPRTGTNNPVSSGAHFGVVGRIVGSLLGLVGALAFAALSVWTGGDALVAGSAKLFGTADSDAVRIAGYAVITGVITFVAVLGHANMLAVQKLMVPTVGVLMIVGVFAYSGDFDAGYAGGEYLLGSFWPTWVLGALAACSTIMSYGPFVGDWARHISPRRHSNRSLLLFTGFGAFFGMGVPFLFGTYTAAVFSDKSAAYIDGLVAASPTWYVPAVMFVGLVAGTAQGTINMYGTGLDMSSIVPRLSRVQATLVVAALAAVLVYVGVFAFAMVDSVTVLLAFLAIVTAPWMLIITIGFVARRGWYDADDLQVFNRGERGGRYWFTHGYNLRAFGAWVPAVVAGCLFSNTTWYTGPGADLLGGVDASFLVSGLLGGAIYAVLLRLVPESPDVHGPPPTTDGAPVGPPGREVVAQV
jgi:purine-cytosine permease-like protein